jgi:hypothetical protein
MSIEVSEWVWQHSQAEAVEKLVLLAIAHEADDSGVARPTVQRLAELCGCAGGRIQRALCAAIERGELKRVLGDGAHTYRFPGATFGLPPLSPLPHSPSLLESTLIHTHKNARDARETDFALSSDPPKKSKQPRATEFAEVARFCASNEMTQDDAVFLWCKWEGNGWTNGSKPIKSWKDTAIAWRQRHNILPSHLNGASNGQKRH